MNEKQIREKVVAAAVAWLGRKESDGSHKEIIDLYNTLSPLPRGYKVTYTDAWCATFVSAVALKCGLLDIMPPECSCFYMVEGYKKLGRWVEDDSYTPAPGDVIFYDWKDGANYAATDDTNAPGHVGIVEKVSGGKIGVIEGNYSDSVKRRSISVNGRYIRGFGIPDYASKAEPEPAAPAPAATEPETKPSGSGDNPSPWAVKGTDFCKAKGIFLGDGAGNYDWQRPITREEVACLLYRALTAAALADSLQVLTE